MNPLAALEPERTPECISDFVFDRWLSSEMPQGEMIALDAHASSCARCQARRAQLLEARHAWYGSERLKLPTKAAARTHRRIVFFAGAGALAMVAAALLIVRGAQEPLDVVRIKGTRSLGFYVKHGDAVRRGAQGEVVAPGDALRFVYTSEQRGYLAVFSLDGARRASVYYPIERDHAAAIEAGREVPLPLSTVLDDVLGEEALIGVFCERSIPLEPLRRALEADPHAAPPAGCSIDRLKIEKRQTLH